jgi:hypothetical protein
MSAHFLRYSVMAAHLSPRLSELDLIDAIAGHFPSYVQRAILSANVRSIQEALSFLNKVEAMESDEAGRRSNSGPPQNRQSPKANNNKHYQGRNDRNRHGEHHVRGFGFRGNSYANRWRSYGSFQPNYNNQTQMRDSRSAEPIRQGGPEHRDLNPHARVYSPSRAAHTHNHGEGTARTQPEN